MSALAEDERAELDRLRRENRLLRVEKDMLLRIATEYAMEHRVTLEHRITQSEVSTPR